MLLVKATPRANPAIVPTTPILAPLSTKMRRIMAREAPLVLHHHDHAGDNIECGDDDNQRQDQEHDVALDLDGIEQARIRLLPVDDPYMAAEGGGDQPTFLSHPVRIADKDFETGDGTG